MRFRAESMGERAMRQKSLRSLVTAGTAALGVTAALFNLPDTAQACGGFFCSSSNPVNQAAEQIIFAQNGDGTVTAVIQIMYQGPSEHFAWLLPVSGVPKVALSSEQALDGLKQMTNPQYQLQPVFGDKCSQFANGGTGVGPVMQPSAGNADGGGVNVKDAGAIGPYDYVVIMVAPDAAEPAQVALDWLTENDYDVGDIGEEVLRPYLADGLNLLAIRLTKGSMTGSIRPVMVTYESELPAIPIRPTAVAANDDMGVLVWVLGGSRAMPSNYKGLELNDALIDWFNPNNNYNKVVSRAADEAMGQGFVTEYAGKVSDFKNQTGFAFFQPYQQQTWDQFMAQQLPDAVSMIQQAQNNWQGYDGLDEALQNAVTLPDTVTFSDFKNCPQCFISEPGLTFDTTEYLKQLYKLVIKPLLDTQDLLDTHSYMTRLYTTMSAEEMTVDPVFDFNADLADVSNIHTAQRTMLCDDKNTDPFSAPWDVEFPQGIVHGTEVGVWPIDIDDQPAALKILQYAKKGQGKVVEDRTDDILKLLAKNGTPSVKPGTGGSGGATSGSGGTTGGDGGSGEAGKGSNSNNGSAGEGGAGGNMGEDGGGMGGADGNKSSDDGCSVGGGSPSSALSLLLFACAALFRRRR
jgi:hypothetical protein